MVTQKDIGKRVIYTHYPEDQELWKNEPGSLSKKSINIVEGASYIMGMYNDDKYTPYIRLRSEYRNESLWAYPAIAFDPEVPEYTIF